MKPNRRSFLGFLGSLPMIGIFKPKMPVEPTVSVPKIDWNNIPVSGIIPTGTFVSTTSTVNHGLYYVYKPSD